MSYRLSKINIVKKRRVVPEPKFSVIKSCISGHKRVKFDVRHVVVAWSSTIKDSKVTPCN